MTAPLLPDPSRIEKHLRQIAVPRDIFADRSALDGIQDYIESELNACGYHISRHTFEIEDIPLSNVMASRQPRPPKRRFLVGAHFDSVPGSPGADDNASGVAVLLETARLLKDEARAEDVVWTAFSAEEYGMLGSRAYVESLADGKITGMLSLEMVGFTSDIKGSQRLPLFLKPFYPETGNFIALVGNGGSKRLLQKCGRFFRNHPAGIPIQTLTVPLNGHVLPEVRLSDHAPFWDAGIPALLVTDTSFFRNPHYHLPGDTPETLNLPFMTKLTQVLAEFLCHRLD